MRPGRESRGPRLPRSARVAGSTPRTRRGRRSSAPPPRPGSPSGRRSVRSGRVPWAKADPRGPAREGPPARARARPWAAPKRPVLFWAPPRSCLAFVRSKRMKRTAVKGPKSTVKTQDSKDNALSRTFLDGRSLRPQLQLQARPGRLPRGLARSNGPDSTAQRTTARRCPSR